MAEPTLTLQQLRRLLARRLKMPFFQRIGDSSTLTASTTTTAARDSAKLGQPDDYWNGSFLYNVTRGEAAYISDFTDLNNEATLEQVITSQASGDTYEIHSIWSAYELRDAINAALRNAFPAFFNYVADESLVVCEDKLSYALSGLSTAPHRLLQVFLEHNDSGTRGVVDSAAVGSITDSALAGFLSEAGVTAGWLISIYKGTGAGQLRTVSTANNTTGQVDVSVNWGTTPDATSYYRLWNPNEQRIPWERIIYGHPDQKIWPDYFHFDLLSPRQYGLRLRLLYTARPTDLSAETDATMVPEEFIIPWAQAVLYRGNIDDTRVDRSRYAQVAQEAMDLALAYRQTNPFRHPDGTLWQSAADFGGMPINPIDPSGNPLGWG
jgi:hypothetical protein